LNLRVQNGYGGSVGALLDQSAQKKLLRLQLRQQRSELSSEFQKIASETITQQLAQLSFIQAATHIAYYWPSRHECDPCQLAELLPNKIYYLPVINKETQLLEFYPHLPEETLQPNQFNILEPSIENKTPIQAKDLEIVLVPLLGFDTQGNRLGMGGGYYDRSFAFLKSSTDKHPLLIGLAYEFQKLDPAPYNDWDIGLNYIITEAQLYKIKPAN